MGHIAGTSFGVGSPATHPLLQSSWGFSPYTPQSIGPHQTTASPLQLILQSLQAVAQQVQQLQQLDYVQQQQLQQLQQWIQVVPQQIQQLQQQLLAQQSALGIPVAGLTGYAASPYGVAGFPFQAQPPFLAGQPGQVM